jgi:hypothetical protein
LRVAFRFLVAITLAIVFLGRIPGGRLLPYFMIGPFLAWFRVSVFVFGLFGLRAAYLAWRDPAHRSAYLFDIIIAVAWIPYWYHLKG